MRRMIAAMQISVDGKIEGPDPVADWVEAWSDTLDLTPEVDACLLGGGMYPGYEQYWVGIAWDPRAPLEMFGGRLPTPDEVAYARFAARTPHYVLSRTMSEAVWPQTRFLRDLGEVEALRRQPGRAIYVVGGAMLTASLIERGLVDELRLMLHPLIAGEGKRLFETALGRRRMRLMSAQPLEDGRVKLAYALT